MWRAILFLGLLNCASAFGQLTFTPDPRFHGRGIPVPPHPATLIPAEPPPVELVDPPATVIKATELPVPVGKQCLRETLAPCRDDASRVCKQLEIGNCD